MRPIVLAYHLIWTAYGWWLPNDPRGSMSQFIAFDPIRELGELHYGRKRVQPASSIIREFYDQAKEALTHPLLAFDDRAVAAISDSFAETIRVERYTCYACAIMSDHIHIIIHKHKHQAEQMIANFQESSRLRLRTEKLRALEHPVWGGPGWKVFLDHPDEINRVIRYVEQNPIKARQSPQRWGFVTKYDGWPFHKGDNPNSPYAKRMRGSR